MIDNVENLPKRENGLIRFFRSEYFSLLTFLAAIYPFMAHTAHLLLQVSDIQNTWYSYFFAFSFDLAIFTFAINGRKSQATGLAFIVFVMNLFYFNFRGMVELLGNGQIARFFVSIIISGAGSWIIHSYVTFFNESIGEKREIHRWQAREVEKDKALNTLRLSLQAERDENKFLKGMLERLTQDFLVKTSEPIDVLKILESGEISLPYTCNVCEQTVMTGRSLESLVLYCKNRNCQYKRRAEQIAEEIISTNQGENGKQY